ncbi:MAG: SusE domain-containing protein, partial [Sphaerochaetaceae bacterium]|nr:SusE domain-containing protein [Sphaerochaetaceae bacterium]
IGFIACNDEDNATPDPNALTLEVSKDTLYLDPAEGNEVALTFSWNKGIDRGAENSVVYYFRMARLGEDFNEDSIDPLEISSEEAREVGFTHQELADLLTDKWGVFPGEEQAFQARVVAKVIGPVFMYPEISYVNVSIFNGEINQNDVE